MRLSAKQDAVRAVDTNIVVRFLTGDDHEQFVRARKTMSDGPIFVATGVCLETEWVLRSVFGYKRAAVASALAQLAGLPEVRLEQPSVVQQAIVWLLEGMDFADALHLASADGCEAMVSFDAKLAKVAKRLGTIPVLAP